MTVTRRIALALMILLCGWQARSQHVLVDPSQRLPALQALLPGYFRNNLTAAGTQYFDAEPDRFNCLRTFELTWKLRTTADHAAFIAAVRSLRALHEDQARKTDVLVIQINAMPRWLSSSTDSRKVFPDDNILFYETVRPADYARWDSLMRDMASVIREWNFTPYYELWNEPDLQYWNGSEAELIELYRHTATAIRSADPGAKVGGFGMNAWSRGIDAGLSGVSGYYPDSLADSMATLAHLIDTCAVSGTPLDFISWHAFSAYPRWIRNGYEYFQRKLASRGLSQCGQVLSEYNATASYRERRWHASYILACIDLVKSYPRFNHAFAAYQDFVADPQREFLQDYGGISRGGLKKPVHHALALLGRVYRPGTAPVATYADVPVTAFSSIAGDTIRTLLSNYVAPPQYAGIDALLFGEEHINTGDLLLAGYAGWAVIDSTIRGLLPPRGDARIVSAFQTAHAAYVRSQADEHRSLDVLLTFSGTAWGASGLLCRVDSTNNNSMFRYDSLLSLGYTRNQAVTALSANQSLRTSPVSMRDSTYRILVPPNGIVYLELRRNAKTVSVHEVPLPEPSLIAYPNPITSALNLDAARITHARITDVLGREVWEGVIDGPIQVNTSSWTQGMYLLFDGTRVLRILKP